MNMLNKFIIQLAYMLQCLYDTQILQYLPINYRNVT